MALGTARTITSSMPARASRIATRSGCGQDLSHSLDARPDQAAPPAPGPIWVEHGQPTRKAPSMLTILLIIVILLLLFGGGWGYSRRSRY